jgi:hypothetical protein
MYDAEKARVDEAARRFQRLVDRGDPDARAAGEDYLDALTDLIQAFDSGPGAEVRVMELDTTGALTRTEDHVAWAEGERHRVRKALRDLN